MKIKHLLFLAFAGAGVSETFGERVVIDLQLRDLNRRKRGGWKEKNVIIIPVVTHARRSFAPGPPMTVRQLSLSQTLLHTPEPRRRIEQRRMAVFCHRPISKMMRQSVTFSF